MPKNPPPAIRSDVVAAVTAACHEQYKATGVPESAWPALVQTSLDACAERYPKFLRAIELASDARSPFQNAGREPFFQAMESVMDKNLGLLAQGVRDGKLGEDGRTGAMVLAMMRGIQRLADLPEDRDLTDPEIDLFQSALLQVAINSLCLLVDLPFDAITVVLAAFDTENPQ